MEQKILTLLSCLQPQDDSYTRFAFDSMLVGCICNILGISLRIIPRIVFSFQKTTFEKEMLALTTSLVHVCTLYYLVGPLLTTMSVTIATKNLQTVVEAIECPELQHWEQNSYHGSMPPHHSSIITTTSSPDAAQVIPPCFKSGTGVKEDMDYAGNRGIIGYSIFLKRDWVLKKSMGCKKKHPSMNNDKKLWPKVIIDHYLHDPHILNTQLVAIMFGAQFQNR